MHSDNRTPLVAVSPIATCAGGVCLPPTGADTGLALRQLALCGGGSLVVVVVDVYVCGDGGCSYGVVVVGKCIGVIQRLASNKETQISSKESGHSIATLWYMSNQPAHILHLYMRWPYFNLHWSVMIF